MFIRIFTLLLLCCTVACQPRDIVDGCGPEALIISEEEWSQDSFPSVTIVDYKINQDCFEVTIGASGCNSENWELEMWGGDPALSLPAQRSVHFRLKNPEACLAYFTRTFSFDIRPLQEDGGNSIWLILTDTKDDKGEMEQVLYEY